MSTQQKKRCNSSAKTTSSAYKSRTDPPRFIGKIFLDGRDPPYTFTSDGIEWERTDRVEINLDAIPQHVAKKLGIALLGEVKAFYADPKNCAARDAWLAERTARR